MNRHSIKYTARTLVAIVVMTTSLTGCNKFLDTAPDDRAKLEELEAIRELLAGAYPDNTYQLLWEIRSDNAVDKGVRAWAQDQFLREIFTFQPQISNTNQDTPSGYWRALYWSTAAANQALESIEELGTLDNPDKKRLADEIKGEALMMRSYNGYMLAQTFCRPYDPATAESMLGLPYPKNPETKVLVEYTRGNLEEMYEQILADFEEGYKLIGSDYAQPKYHFTKTSAAAYGTRLFRTLGDWDRVIELASQVFGSSYTNKIRDYSKYSAMTYAGSKAAWSLPEEDWNLMVNTVLSYWNWQCGDSRYAVNLEEFKNFDFSDSFMGKHPEPQFNYTGMRQYGEDLYLNFAKHASYLNYTNAAKTNWYEYSGVVIFTGEEVLFNLAEALVMKERYDEAIQLLQTFISRWFVFYAPNSENYKVTREKIESYYTSDQQELKPHYTLNAKQVMYLKAILYTKRFAFVHEGLRWLDIRHYNLPVTHVALSDNDTRTTVHKLESGDPRYAYQLPSSVLGYKLEPNPGYEASGSLD